MTNFAGLFSYEHCSTDHDWDGDDIIIHKNCKILREVGVYKTDEIVDEIGICVTETGIEVITYDLNGKVLHSYEFDLGIYRNIENG